jgi:UDP-glucose 4-epimerase
MLQASMRILITGGAGFIGSHVAEAALAAGHDVAVLDDFSTGKRRNVPFGTHLLFIDLRDREATFRAVAEYAPEVVSHQAAQASVAISMRDPRLDAEINVLGTINLLDACIAHGTRRFVFASTGGAIYGEVPEPRRADEHWPRNPVSPYAISKLYVEQLLDVYRTQHGLAATTLRYANVYGPRQDPHGEAGVVAIFLNAALAGRSVRINAKKTAGDDGCIRDYVYVADVARANVLALEGHLPEQTLNVATGIGTSTRELATRIFAASHTDSPIELHPPRPGDLERSVLDPTACKRALGTLTSLEEGLKKTVSAFAHPLEKADSGD